MSRKLFALADKPTSGTRRKLFALADKPTSGTRRKLFALADKPTSGTRRTSRPVAPGGQADKWNANL